MSKKIEKIREDIRKEEARIREMEEHVKTLRMQEKHLENEEIIRQIRGMTGKNKDILDTLRNLSLQESPNEDMDQMNAPNNQEDKPETDIGYNTEEPNWEEHHYE